MNEAAVCNVVTSQLYRMPTGDANVPVSCYTENYLLTSYFGYWEYWNCKSECDKLCLDGGKDQAGCDAEADAAMKVACKTDFRVSDPKNTEGLAACDNVCPEWKSDRNADEPTPYCEGAFDLRPIFNPEDFP